MWKWGIEPPTHMRDGTQPRSQLVKSRMRNGPTDSFNPQRVEGCENGASLFTVPKSTKSHTKEYSLSASCYITNAQPFSLTMSPH